MGYKFFFGLGSGPASGPVSNRRRAMCVLNDIAPATLLAVGVVVARLSASLSLPPYFFFFLCF